MSVFAIADLHLSHSTEKPMDIFGSNWENHMQKLRQNWLETVSETDTVVIAGDVSWGMRIAETEEDFRYLESLPGEKIILRGNHDYWWQTMKKLQELCVRLETPSLHFLHNNAYEAENFIVCGSRGWALEPKYSDEDRKIVLREAGRLRTSILAGKKLQEAHPEKELLVFLHYPPAYGLLRCDALCEVLAESGVKRVFYGHMHHADQSRLVRQIAGASSELIAADHLQFTPKRILPISE